MLGGWTAGQYVAGHGIRPAPSGLLGQVVGAAADDDGADGVDEAVIAVVEALVGLQPGDVVVLAGDVAVDAGSDVDHDLVHGLLLW
jgi:hypothetical protein